MEIEITIRAVDQMHGKKKVRMDPQEIGESGVHMQARSMWISERKAKPAG